MDGALILGLSALGLGWALFFRPEGWPAPDFLSVLLAPALLIILFGGSYFLTRGTEWTALLRSTGQLARRHAANRKTGPRAGCASAASIMG